MAQESTATVYVTIAVLMTISSISLLLVPIEILVSGAKTGAFITAVSSALGETGTRLLLSLPCALLAFVAFRQWRKSPK